MRRSRFPGRCAEQRTTTEWSISRIVEDAEERRRQAVERAAQVLARAIVDLVEAATMPRNEPQSTITSTRRRPDYVLTMKEVCEITGLRPSTFYNLRGKKEGPPFFVIRNRVRCYRSDLDEWMSATRVSNSAQV